MFHTIADTDTLASFFDPVDALADECKVHLDDEGLAVRAVDPANVGMVAIDCDAAAFESYAADGGLIGTNIETVTDAIGFADSPAELELDAETRKLHVTDDTTEFELALIDPEAIRQEPDIPDLDLPVDVTVAADDFTKGVEIADWASDHVALAFDTEAGELRFEADGDTDSVSHDLGREDILEGGAEADARSLFSLEYLVDMADVIPSGGEVRVQLGDEMPVFIEYDIGAHISVTNALAPRIQSD